MERLYIEIDETNDPGRLRLEALEELIRQLTQSGVRFFLDADNPSVTRVDVECQDEQQVIFVQAAFAMVRHAAARRI